MSPIASSLKWAASGSVSLDAPKAVTRTDGQNVNQNIDPLGRRSNQSGAGVLAASFGYNDTNGVGSLGSITTYQGAVTSNNGTLSGSGAAVTSFGYDPATGLPTSKTYAGQSAPTDAINYNSKFQLSATSHGTVTGNNFIYNPAGELTGSSLTDTATGDVLTRGIPQLDAKGRPQVFSQSTLDTNGATTGSATNVLTYTPQDQVGSESFSTVANDKLVYDYFQPGDASANASPGSIKDMKIETSAGSVLAEYDYQYEPSSKRLLNITLKGANAGSDQVFTYGYQANSNLVESLTAGSGLTTIYAYEPATGRLSSINAANHVTDQTDYNAVYGYYANDQRSTDTISRINADGSTQNYNTSYTYDTSDQLKTATSAATVGTAPANFSANYDGVGNRTDLGLGTVSLVNQYASLTYDSRGNTINDGVNAYTYDPADRLTSVTPNAPTASSLKCVFQYDVQGRRTQKDVFAWAGGAWVFSYSRKWLYDGRAAVAEFDGSDNLLKSFAWGQGNQLLAITDFTGTTPKVYNTILDAQGNVVALTDTSGAVVASFAYDPYGKLLSTVGSAAGESPFLYGGGYRDSESGLILLDHRYYSPALGRFLTRDPSGESGGTNLYRYANGDPVNLSDRSGLAATWWDPSSWGATGNDSFVGTTGFNDLGVGRVRVTFSIYLRHVPLFASGDAYDEAVGSQQVVLTHGHQGGHFAARFGDKIADLNQLLATEGKITAYSQSIEVLKQAAVWAGTAGIGQLAQAASASRVAIIANSARVAQVGIGGYSLYQGGQGIYQGVQQARNGDVIGGVGTALLGTANVVGGAQLSYRNLSLGWANWDVAGSFATGTRFYKIGEVMPDGTRAGVGPSTPSIFNPEFDAPRGSAYRTALQVRIDAEIPGRPDPAWSIDTSEFAEGVATANGGIRNNVEFWKQWAALRPETLSPSNAFRIHDLELSPRIDEAWITSFPEHADYISETLIHHHVDSGPFAIPVPGSTHVGFGPPWH